jgi:hypothetical protein
MDDLWELSVQDLEWCVYSCAYMPGSFRMLQAPARWLKSLFRHDTDRHVEDELPTAKCRHGCRSLQTTMNNKKPIARHSMGFASWTQGRILLFGGQKGEIFGD